MSGLHQTGLWPGACIDALLEHIEIVGQFLNGNGIRGATAGTKPYFFCDDSFATYAPWDQIAKDASGQDIPDRVNGGFITVQTLFSNIKGTTQRNIPVLPFWADKFNAYIFSGVSQQRLCDGTIFAHTPRARDSTYANNHVDVEAGTFGRFIYFCDKGWNSRPGTTATVASLADIVTYEGYPTAGSDEQEIVDLMPISATFYHELYHLTDQTDLPTDDNYSMYILFYSLGETSNLNNLLITIPEISSELAECSTCCKCKEIRHFLESGILQLFCSGLILGSQCTYSQ